MDSIEILIPDKVGNHLVVALTFYDDSIKTDTFQIPEELCGYSAPLREAKSRLREHKENLCGYSAPLREIQSHRVSNNPPLRTLREVNLIARNAFIFL